MVPDTSHWPQRKPLAISMRCDIQRHGNSLLNPARSRVQLPRGCGYNLGAFFKGVGAWLNEKIFKSRGGGVKVSILADMQKFKRSMNNIEKKEFPLIVRNSLLDTGFRTQKKLRTQTYGKAFNPRQKQFKNVTTSLGTGSPAQPQSGVILKKGVARRKEIVIFDRTSKEYMQRHAKGGIKRPVSGSNIAIPGKDTVEPRRTGRGIPKKLRPDALRGDKKTFRIKINGQDVIAKRVGKARYPLAIMHLLEPSATIRKTYNFYEDAQSSFRSEFPAAFRRNFNSRMKRVLKTSF